MWVNIACSIAKSDMKKSSFVINLFDFNIRFDLGSSAKAIYVKKK